MIGTDIVEIDRIRQALNKPGFLHGVFSQSEIDYCNSRPDPVESFAGIFCAKEAVVKATGYRDALTLTKVEISHDLSGRPKGLYLNREYEVSISHCRDYAMAVALLARHDG